MSKMKFFKFFEYVYAGFGLFFLYEGIVNWNSSQSRAWLFLAMAFVAGFMFFFKRHYRKKMEGQDKP